MVAFIGGLGGWELLLVVAVILVVFGPERLPEMARKFAAISQKVRTANRDFQREMYRNLDPDEIVKDSPASEPTASDPQVPVSEPRTAGPHPPVRGKNVEIEKPGSDEP